MLLKKQQTNKKYLQVKSFRSCIKHKNDFEHCMVVDASSETANLLGFSHATSPALFFPVFSCPGRVSLFSLYALILVLG